MDNHTAGLLDSKKHPVVSNPQSVFKREGRQSFDVSREVVFQFFQCIDDPSRVGFGDSMQILPGSRLQFDFISHDLLPSYVL
jgi:hypothetical protein